ncbi:MAG TPA: hypothetical protein VMW81_07380 [Nitrospinota bacterium]|nr:hypothetical protein [Nitrospinota bacterium]
MEKILKAYILGTRTEEYEYLSENEAREKINEIAKSRELGHNLKKMIEKLISKNILSRNVFTDLFTKCGEKK